MEYYAHKTEDGRCQTVKEHLENVVEKARDFSVEPVKSLAYEVGIGHDIGKYSSTFQKRLDGGNEKFEHSVCGAIEFEKMQQNKCDKVIFPMMEYCIAGHHTGLPNGGTGGDLSDDSSLQSRLKRKNNYNGENDYSVFGEYVKLSSPDYNELFKILTERQDMSEFIERYAFFTRYLFSCLTDADFLDTEEFYLNKSRENLKADFNKVSHKLVEKFESFKAETDLQKARGRLQDQALNNSFYDENISMLNMPTGSGKTLCSLKIALDKLLSSNGKIKRIIYVIPYTSIIEQTADLFDNIFGEYADILQHHSNYIFDEKDENINTVQKLKKACENWDSPFVITTSVQFFQSLYHYKSSGLRKFHNMADSIIVFDEIHLLPIKILQPCLRAIGYITKYCRK